VSDTSTGGLVLSGLKLFQRRVARDRRGAFAELWREEDAQAIGLPMFVQDNVARSRRGVVRGLHFQNPRSQAKLVTVVLGEIFEVAVDVRVGSPTFGQWSAVRLSDANDRQLFIPPGFAHGYQTISESSVVVYKCSDYYAPEYERAVRWNDATVGIDWPIPDAIVSPRDADAPLLRDLVPEWLPQRDR
jgi:dTDP-4-dehydrorhamnose 3,5-epimerase